MNKHWWGIHSEILSSAFSPDGRHIITESREGTVRVWDAITGVCERILTVYFGRLCSPAFSPDGQHIVTRSSDLTVRVWNTSTGACERPLVGHKQWVMSAEFSPYSSRIVSASFDKTVRVWNTVTGACEHILTGFESSVRSAAFSPDGTSIVTVSEDGIVRLWRDTRARAQTRALALALSCAQHSRLGQHSPAGLIDANIMHMIASFGLADSFGSTEQPEVYSGVLATAIGTWNYLASFVRK